MPTFLHFHLPQGTPWITYGRDVLGRIVATPTYAWARFIVVVAGTEMLDRAHGLLIEWVARCVSISTYFGVFLMFSSMNARFGRLAEELGYAIDRADTPAIGYMVVRFVLLGGEYFLVRMLERTVSFFFFAWSVG